MTSHLIQHCSFTPAAPAGAPATGTDYYSRNQYHVHGAYSKPSGPSYDSSGYGSASYGNTQVSHLSDIHYHEASSIFRYSSHCQQDPCLRRQPIWSPSTHFPYPFASHLVLSVYILYIFCYTLKSARSRCAL